MGWEQTTRQTASYCVTHKMDVISYIGVFTLLCLGYCFIRLVQLLLSDCDLQLKSCTLKAEYYKNKVVWLVGASVGSKYRCILL